MKLEEEPVRITAVGDVFLGDHYFTVGHGIATASRNGMLGDCLQDVKPVLEEADIVLGNLECPISHHSEREEPVQRACFRGIPGSGAVLRDAGFTALSVANNHVLQHGPRAFEDTLDELDKAGIEPVGLAATDGTPEPLVLNIRGTTIGVIGFSLVPERYAPNYGGYARGTEQELLDAVGKLKPQVDKTVVMLHFGDEGVALPSPWAQTVCSRLVGNGVDLILGHHPHIFQPVVSMKNSVVAFSLGNFLFDMFWDHSFVETAIVHFSLSGNAWTLSLTPVKIENDCRLRVMEGDSALRFRRQLARRAGALRYSTLYRRLYPTYSSISRLLVHLKKYPWFAIHYVNGARPMKRQFFLEKIGVKKIRNSQASPRTRRF